MKRIISAIVIAATVSGAALPAYAGAKHGGGKGGHSHMAGHGGKGGFGHFGGKGLAAGVIGAAVGAMLIDALSN
jgi:hypothetical protein